MSGEDRRSAPEGKWPRKNVPPRFPIQGSTSAGDAAPEQSGGSVPPPGWMHTAGIAPTTAPADTLPTAILPSYYVIPDAVPFDKQSTAILPTVPTLLDTQTAVTDTSAFGASEDDRPTTILPTRLPLQRSVIAHNDDISEDERPTTVLPARGKSHGRRMWSGREPGQMNANTGGVPPQLEDGDTPIDQLETAHLPAQGTLLRDVTRAWFTGPLPIIDVDQHFTGPLPTTGPLPAVMVDRIVAKNPVQQDHWLQSSPARNAQRRHITLTNEEDEQLDMLARMSTEIMPAISGDVGPFLPSEQETARTKAARSAKSQTFVVNLAKSSGVYALSALAAPLISLVLAPFLTGRLTPSEYGILAVVTTAIGLAAGITQLGLNSAFFRAYNYDYTSTEDRYSVVSTVSMILIGVGLPACAGIVFGAPLIASLLLGDVSLAPLVRIAGLVFLAQNLAVPGYAWLRAESKALYFSLLSIISLVVTLVTNIVFVGMLGLGLAGAIAASGIGYASVVIFTMPFILLRAGIRFRRDMAVSLLAFGLPLVLNFVSYWILQLSDRFLLARIGTLTETAQYAVAYTMGSALSALIISPFTLAWPTSMFTIAKRKDAAHIFGIVFRGFAALLYFAAFGLSLLATLFLQQLFPPTYREAGPIIALITASIVFYGVYFLFMIGANVRRKTWLTAVFTTSAALLNVGLNLVLIPQFGGLGAAASTLIAYAVLAGFAYIVNQWIYPLPFKIGIWLLMGGIGVALYVACWQLPLPHDQLKSWICRFAICLLYGLLLFVYGGGIRVLRLVMRRSRRTAPKAEGAIA